MYANMVDRNVILAKIMAEYDVKRDTVVSDIKLAELGMEEISKQRESDNRHRNIMMGRALLQLAIEDGNVKEARLCLADVCKLEASYPVKDPSGGINSLLELARQAAERVGQRVVGGEEPSIEVLPPAKKTPPLPTALRVGPEEEIDPERLKELAEGRIEDSGAEVTKARSGALRITRSH